MAKAMKSLATLDLRLAQEVVKEDAKTATEVWHRDDDVDRKYARLMTELRQQMQEDTLSVETGTCLIFMGRYLERIGDQITNISEAIYYIETGKTYIGTLDS